MAQTNAERQETFTERQKRLGLKLVRNLWAHPDDFAKIKADVAKANRRRGIDYPRKT